ncbi:hypothetical protein HPB50_005270 [Hyalomma asiaticum]|uniref:Uncharacterized protein n=1 Tax=Hyalomma asiaticum TaxID=266040 RepID=A0ACB7T0I0_HYAAI|nr:hypothetical protein HPB50_005270 [Hyalomma asiaticum]
MSTMREALSRIDQFLNPDNVIDNVCAEASLLTDEDYFALDRRSFSWLWMAIGGLQPMQVHEGVRRCLEMIQDDNRRLQCIAELRAWLIPRRVYRDWWFYRLDTSLAQLDKAAFRTRLIEVLQSAGYIAAHGSEDAGSFMCVSVLTVPPECKPICFAIWREYPYVAVHAPRMSADEALGSPVLAIVLGDLEKCMYGTFENLRIADRAVTRELFVKHRDGRLVKLSKEH